MQQHHGRALPLLFLTTVICIVVLAGATQPASYGHDFTISTKDRSPVDCVLSADERFLYTANQTSGTVSVVDLASKKVTQELACGAKPTHIAITPDGKRLLVSATFAHELVSYAINPDGSLNSPTRLWLGFEPRGIAIDAAGKFAYVALCTSHQVAVVDLNSFQAVAHITTSRWPRALAFTKDDKMLIASCSGDGALSFIDVANRKLIRDEPFAGLNQGQLAVSNDGEFAYTPYIYHFGSGPNERTIKLGWVTASRVARIRIKEEKRVSSLYLDTAGKAVADPVGLAISDNEEWLVCSGSGTQELLLFRNKKLPFQGFNSRFLIDEDLRQDEKRYQRLDVGGRPMYLHFSKDNKHLYVANYLLNAIQIIDVPQHKIVETIALGGPVQPSLAREGEAIFYDGKRSFDQWYSCASCHFEGHSNGIAMDTRNDGRFGNPKMVPSLRYVAQTGPWTWHGWQKSLPAAMQKSMQESMLGKKMTDHEVKALITYFSTLEGPKSPHLGTSGELNESAQRGKAIFASDKAGCANCHRGEYFTDNKVHEVGLESSGDYYKGFNPPTLRGVYDRLGYTHDGQVRTLEQLLRGPHSPEKVTGNGKLSEGELKDLVEYLKTL